MFTLWFFPTLAHFQNQEKKRFFSIKDTLDEYRKYDNCLERHFLCTNCTGRQTVCLPKVSWYWASRWTVHTLSLSTKPGTRPKTCAVHLPLSWHLHAFCHLILGPESPYRPLSRYPELSISILSWCSLIYLNIIYVFFHNKGCHQQYKVPTSLKGWGGRGVFLLLCPKWRKTSKSRASTLFWQPKHPFPILETSTKQWTF